MKILARTFNTLTTSQAYAGHSSLGGKWKKSIYILFFFMQLFTGHVSSAITLALWARSCVASGKNQKCKCPPGPCRRCEQVYQAGRGHWWVEKEAPSKGAWPTRSCQGEIAQSWQVFTFFPWEARKSSPLLKYWQPKGNNRCQAQILEAYHFSVYELTSSKGISVSGGFSETSKTPLPWEEAGIVRELLPSATDWIWWINAPAPSLLLE